MDTSSNNNSSNSSKKSILTMVSIILILVLFIYVVYFSNIFKSDAEIVNKFLDKKETVLYDDVGTGLCFNTFFFDKNQENGLGYDNSDIFYLVQIREFTVYNQELKKDETYYFQTSTIFKWGGFLDDSTDVETALIDCNGRDIGRVVFNNFHVDQSSQRLRDYNTEEWYCFNEYFSSKSSSGESMLVSYAKVELADLVKRSRNFVRDNELPDLIQWE